MRNSSVRSLRVALAVYLSKLRLGMSNVVLASMFRLNGKRAVSRILQQVRQKLSDNFAPHYVGLVVKCEKQPDRKSTRLNSSHTRISYAVFCLKKKNSCPRTRAASP